MLYLRRKRSNEKKKVANAHFASTHYSLVWDLCLIARTYPTYVIYLMQKYE